MFVLVPRFYFGKTGRVKCTIFFQAYLLFFQAKSLGLNTSPPAGSWQEFGSCILLQSSTIPVSDILCGGPANGLGDLRTLTEMCMHELGRGKQGG